MRTPTRLLVVLLVVWMAASIAACRSSDGKASFETVEESRAHARENVTRLAEAWQKANGFELYRLDVRDDPTIAADCPQGDGWAEAAIIDKTTQQTVRLLECSTVSPSLGCMTSATFAASEHRREDGACNTSLPAPLPRLR